MSEDSETPRDRFLRLAPPRTEAALKRIKLLGNLAGSGYKFEPDEARQICDALAEAVRELMERFDRRADTRKESGFSFQLRKKSILKPVA